MTLYTLRYRGYSIHGTAAKPEVTYQAPAWPADPRIIKAPSLETAKRWIREELRRLKKHGLKNAVYLALVRKAPKLAEFIHFLHTTAILDPDYDAEWVEFVAELNEQLGL